MSSPLRLVSWNIGHRFEAWRLLPDADFDVALLQEAGAPPQEVANAVEVDSGAWETAGQSPRAWRTAIVRLSDRVRMTPRRTGPLGAATGDDLPVSRMGTLAVADIEWIETRERLTLASVYGAWEHPSPYAKGSWSYADASVHRVLSDLSALLVKEEPPPLLVAGDLNIYRGYGDKGSQYWKERYATVFSRATALGLRFVGPQAPDGRHPAKNRPPEVPRGCQDIPTLRTNQVDPSSATRQLDFVFASESLARRITVRALNGDEEWGPSDHCRIVIDLRLD